MSGKLVLVRHAESVWNKEKRLSGNSQIGLTVDGLYQSIDAAKELMEKNLIPSIAFSSDQKRAIDTLDIMLKEMNLTSIPTVKNKALRESELGALNGVKLSDIEEQYGRDFIFKLLREFDTKAPPKEGEPAPESLRDMVIRVGEFFESDIKKHLSKGRTVLLVAHDGTLRALLTHLKSLDENESRIRQFDNAKPYIYEYKGSE
jgi:2,3-bisphosphoglycerate-dependent phosphoglycerate mutase